MLWIYNTGIFFYVLSIRIASLFNPKAKLWTEGRKNIFNQLENTFKNEKGSVIWFHCASLGEFEQGRPIIEKIKANHSQYKILITFFSPSGYEIRKNYSGADYVFYLPIDTALNAKKFIEIIQPKMAFFIKYEFWYHYLHTLKNKKIPTYLISALFRKNQIFFKPYGSLYRNILKCYDYIFVQDDDSMELLMELGLKNICVSGDTRYDRVSEIAAQTKSLEIIENFKAEKKLIVAGSSWPPEEQLIATYIGRKGFTHKFIIAPHDISENHLLQLERLFSKYKCLRYSKANNIPINEYEILIIDNIGLLSSLYKYADIAFIGGAFGSGLHNILEAVVYGCPVVFGPKYYRFPEAVELLNAGGACSVRNVDELINDLNFLSSPENKEFLYKICTEFVASRKGATEKILNLIKL
ncbi:MAG: 3-deoxy-D-manno-octulosonic acid transferase [Bacteroidia bacterium]